MEKLFISEPMDFDYKEGNSVDFEKTFDLTGNDNDQMLRVYLTKAGLADNIEHLSAEQRKAFIYDIVKSNKNPGYWKPSVLPPTGDSQAHISATNSKFSESLLSIDDIPPASMTFDIDHYAKINSHTHSIHEERCTNVSNGHKPTSRGTLYERQFQKQNSTTTKVYETPPTSLSPSPLVNKKGLKIEVSAPINFRHVSGDMTRDMSKNAFDLSGQFNDNALKKYMIERGITEEDIKGMNTKDLIRKIVQSKYTWMPIHPHSGNFIPPPPCETTYVHSSPLPPPRHKHHSKGGALIVSSPIVPEVDAHLNENIYLEIPPQEQKELCTTPIAKRPTKPPPAAPSPISKQNNSKASLSEKYIPPPPPPPPPTGLQLPSERSFTKKVGVPPPMPTLNTSSNVPPPPPPPPPTFTSTNGIYPPPPPPLVNPANNSTVQKHIEPETDSRDALLESIRAGKSLKKVNKQSPNTVKLTSNNQSQISAPPNTVKEKAIKPAQPDFMSELRNATLKRIKKLENNPYAVGSETNC